MKIKNKKYTILIVIFFLILIILYNTSYKTEKENSLSLNSEIDRFNLITHNNKNFNDKYFSGYPSLLFFGFLNCPDICPMTLEKISKIIKEYDLHPDKVRFYFITVDPDRDNRQSIKEYLSNFNTNIIGITGEKESIKNFLKHMYVYSEKVYLGDDIYTIDHSSQIFIFDSKGNFFGTTSIEEQDNIILDKINKVVNGA